MQFIAFGNRYRVTTKNTKNTKNTKMETPLFALKVFVFFMTFVVTTDAPQNPPVGANLFKHGAT